MSAAWFFPAFVVLWLLVCGILSFIGGWQALSERFASGDSLEGERFRFCSGSLGLVNYNTCLFATIGPAGIALSVLPIYRFMHPRLVIRWSEVVRCEEQSSFLRRGTRVHLAGSDHRLVLRGGVGERVHSAWAGRRRS